MYAFIQIECAFSCFCYVNHRQHDSETKDPKVRVNKEQTTLNKAYITTKYKQKYIVFKKDAKTVFCVFVHLLDFIIAWKICHRTIKSNTNLMKHQIWKKQLHGTWINHEFSWAVSCWVTSYRVLLTNLLQSVQSWDTHHKFDLCVNPINLSLFISPVTEGMCLRQKNNYGTGKGFTEKVTIIKDLRQNSDSAHKHTTYICTFLKCCENWVFFCAHKIIVFTSYLSLAGVQCITYICLCKNIA